MARTDHVRNVLEAIFGSLQPEDRTWFLNQLQSALNNSLPLERLASVRAFLTPANNPLESIMIDKTIADLLAALQANTAAVEANTLALKSGGTVNTISTGSDDGAAKAKSDADAAAAAKAKADKKAADAKAKADAEAKPKAKRTREELASAMGLMKEKKGTPAAKALIKEVGLSEGLANVAEENIDALYDAATKAVADDEEVL